MKFIKDSFLSGFGSVLTVYPPEVTSVSKLRKTSPLASYQFTPISEVASRKVDAEVIRKALANITNSSVDLEKFLKNFAEGVELCHRHGQDEDSNSFDSKRAVDSKHSIKIKIYRPGERSETSKIYSVFTDHVRGLADMLAIRRDWQKTSSDLEIAKQSLASE
jgi:hypothetical protein